MDRRFEDPCNALAMAAGLQLSEGTEGLRTPAMLWQWLQGSQLSEGTEGLGTLAFLWQWPQSLQLSKWTEGLRAHAMIWQWPFQAPGRICKFQNDQACSAS